MKRDPYVEGRVLSADPIELIHIIYQHALDMVAEARRFLATGDIAARSKAVCRALEAIAELEGSLNHAQGGDFSRNCARLYQYIRMRLTAGNVNQDDAPLAEVERLLRTLEEAWGALCASGIAGQGAPASEANVPPPAAWGGGTAAMVEYGGHSWSA